MKISQRNESQMMYPRFSWVQAIMFVTVSPLIYYTGVILPSQYEMEIVLHSTDAALPRVEQFSEDQPKMLRPEMIHTKNPMPKRLELVHIPKCGGTSMEQAFSQQCSGRWGACHFLDLQKSISISQGELLCPYSRKGKDESLQMKQMLERKIKSENPKCDLWHAPPYLFEDVVFPEMNPYQDADLFAVIRNPYDRMISEYNYRHKQVPAESKTAKDMNDWLQTRLEELSSKSNGSKIQHPRSLTEYCQQEGGHWLPQYHYIYDSDGKQIVQHTLRMDGSLTEQFESLMKKYDMDITLTHLNKAKPASSQPRLSKQDLSLSNRLLIEKLYIQDFEAFGYPLIQRRTTVM